MDKKLIGYWVVTGLFCVAMAGGGVMDLLKPDQLKEEFKVLGYPEYLMTILGVAKIAGVIALLIPGAGRLKEWAYAGFAFDLLGASMSHAFVGDPIPKIVVPVVLLGIAVTSYLLRPESRRMDANAGSAEEALAVE